MIEIEDEEFEISTEETKSEDNSLIEQRRIDLNEFLNATQKLQHDIFGVNKQRQLCLTPIFQHIKLDQTFHLISDFFFDLGFKERKTIQEQMLSFSHFKRVVYTEHLQNSQVLILHLENPQEPMKDFSQLLQLLTKQPYKRLRILSKLLQEYQKVLINYEQQIQIIQISRLLNQQTIDEKMIARKLFREQQLHKKFKELSNEGQFYTFSFETANIERGYFEITQQGYSDSLICLLGSDPQQFAQTIMRKGYPEIQAQRNRDIFNIGRLNYEMFECNLRNCRFVGCDCCLLTFDDQVIQCSSIIEHLFFDYPEELQINGDQFKIEYGLFVLFQIELNQLKQVISLRQNNKFMENSDWINDFGYSMMSEILLEKYYKINQSKQSDEMKDVKNFNFGERFQSII
ncbi:hypothetical protein TTHERM_00530249 (macronuclear) [Tetrahymena thermophila SB210]|uniref:Uncharacterized protein n=1 Tax=Tetrahymena thermophila (strain SB210) TaxID=312017 RepID=A4VF22_TETTS|nr:hypothetical protein TTHERM_00530249 [Tetrahymena thermophila SB210]EDK31225.1 hypothetical protein TTHERM_00530249 [Tetrahymena thermophila SB210]|eukprot:XP_001470663.1 hypothetical protein TTHERM_00530249 [Tetrahymena thermophila SB210]